MKRRAFLIVALPALPARAQTGLWPEWFGAYSGTVRFYRSIPLHDIYPPPAAPPTEADDPTPFAVSFSIRAEDQGAVVWLRIDGGPMLTAGDGETLRFGPAMAGFAKLVSVQSKIEPLSASLTLRPDSLGTEALFAFADGSFWRRHFNVRFTPTGAELILWVFDANGTRARTWRGSAKHLSNQPQDGRVPT